nr:hypothetical protein CFP56_34898 [Quercus suber]
MVCWLVDQEQHNTTMTEVGGTSCLYLIKSGALESRPATSACDNMGKGLARHQRYTPVSQCEKWPVSTNRSERFSDKLYTGRSCITVSVGPALEDHRCQRTPLRHDPAALKLARSWILSHDRA